MSMNAQHRSMIATSMPPAGTQLGRSHVAAMKVTLGTEKLVKVRMFSDNFTTL